MVELAKTLVKQQIDVDQVTEIQVQPIINARLFQDNRLDRISAVIHLCKMRIPNHQIPEVTPQTVVHHKLEYLHQGKGLRHVALRPLSVDTIHQVAHLPSVVYL